MNLQFNKRLFDLRESMGLSQDEMAKKIEMSKRSYCAYELGETAPSAKLLTALAIMGVDIGYLLTGTRTVPVQNTLSQPEQAILEHYRKTDEVGQRAIEQTASALAQSTQKAAGKKRA